jgi:hypothetical protein
MKPRIMEASQMYNVTRIQRFLGAQNSSDFRKRHEPTIQTPNAAAIVPVTT